MSKRPIVQVKPREGKRARLGAPWLFANEIAMSAETRAFQNGTLVEVVGDDGREFGVGMFNAGSLIAVRLLGAARGTAIDQAFFAARLKRALRLREAYAAAPYYRLVNAEGDLLPGLTIDRFDDVASVQVSAAGMESLLDPLLAALDAVLAPKTVVLRADTPSRAREGLDSYVRTVKGDAGRIDVLENGLRYFADVSEGQKTGWYYDQRENRSHIAALAKGKRLLDAYCYSGGFALLAAKAGAAETVGIDSSASALALAEEAAAANGLSARFIKSDVSDALSAFAKEGERFDVVIADPPPFAKSRKDVEVASRAYRKLAQNAARCVAPDGYLFLASCSHAVAGDRFAFECAQGIAKAGRAARLVRQAGAGFDHPMHPSLPESAYLKALLYALD